MAIGEANGNSSTFTIIKITIGYTDRLCGHPVVQLENLHEISHQENNFGDLNWRTKCTNIR